MHRKVLESSQMVCQRHVTNPSLKYWHNKHYARRGHPWKLRSKGVHFKLCFPQLKPRLLLNSSMYSITLKSVHHFYRTVCMHPTASQQIDCWMRKSFPSSQSLPFIPLRWRDIGLDGGEWEDSLMRLMQGSPTASHPLRDEVFNFLEHMLQSFVWHLAWPQAQHMYRRGAGSSSAKCGIMQVWGWKNESERFAHDLFSCRDFAPVGLWGGGTPGPAWVLHHWTTNDCSSCRVDATHDFFFSVRYLLWLHIY